MEDRKLFGSAFNAIVNSQDQILFREPNMRFSATPSFVYLQYINY